MSKVTFLTLMYKNWIPVLGDGQPYVYKCKNFLLKTKKKGTTRYTIHHPLSIIFLQTGVI